MPPAPTVSASASAKPKPAPRLENVYDIDYDGTIGPSQIYVQLAKDARVGRYFYGKKGAFLTLAGTTVADTSVTLVESAGKVTGTFTLTREADGFTGTWESADKKRQLPVSMHALQRKPGEPVVLVTKAIKRTLKASEPAALDPDASGCDVDIEYFQVLGLSDRKLQAKLDARLRAPDHYDCHVPGTHFGKPTVHMNERGVLSVDFGWGFVEVGHGRGEAEGGHINALVDHGIDDLPADQILQVDHLASIRKVLEARVEADTSDTAWGTLPDHIRPSLVDSMVNKDVDIRLGPSAVVFCAEAGFPQAFDALEGCHYEIPYTDLAKVLVPKSPARFLWSKL